MPYIEIAGRKLHIEIDGSGAADVRLADGELSEQCDDCGADISESMRLAFRRPILICWTCRMRYPIKSE